MVKFLFILLFCLLTNSILFAQSTHRIDSLENVLKRAKEDENKVLLLIRIGQEYENFDLEKSKAYYRKAKKLGEKINYPHTEIKFVSNYTFALNMQGKFDSSLYWNLKGIDAAKKLNRDEDLAKAYFNTGTSYHYMGDYITSSEFYQKGLVLFEKKGNTHYMAQVHDILQNLYKDTRQFNKAKSHGKKAVLLFRTLDDQKMLAYALTNLGVTYGTINQKDSSLIYQKEASSIAKKIDDEILLATIELNLADVYMWKKQYEQSKLNYLSALKNARKHHLPSTESTALRGLSYYYTQTGDYDKALLYVQDALNVAEKNKLIPEKIEALQQLTALAYIDKDIEEADGLESQVQILRDSLLNDQIIAHTINTEKRFELDKKNTKLQLQEEKINRKNLLNWLLIGSLASLILVSVLGYRNYNHRKKLQQQRITELETEKQLLATQSLLKGQEEERTRIAKDLHDGLGGLLSGVKLQLGAMKGNLILTEENGNAFNRALNKLDESISEMRRVAHNMMPETLLKFGLEQALTDYKNGLTQGQNLTIDCEFFGLAERLNSSVEIVVYRIVQELINNAVKHSEASKILVQLMRHEDQLNITVEDNGKGFNLDKMKIGNSAGLQNIQSRVNYLNGKMDIQSQPGNGTSIYIECELNPNG